MFSRARSFATRPCRAAPQDEGGSCFNEGRLILRSSGFSRGVAKDAKRATQLCLALLLAACGAPAAPAVDDAVLRALADAGLWKSIVREGAKSSLGMADFGEMIDDETSEAIRAYVIAEANSDRDAAYYARIAGTEKRP
jgi:hypothetical protein